MSESSATLDPRTRKTLALILQGLARHGQKPVAEALGVSEATVSRMKDADLERFARLLTAIGMKPVPVEAKCYDAAYIDHLRYFARLGFDRHDEPAPLDWGDE